MQRPGRFARAFFICARAHKFYLLSSFNRKIYYIFSSILLLRADYILYTILYIIYYIQCIIIQFLHKFARVSNFKCV